MKWVSYLVVVVAAAVNSNKSITQTHTVDAKSSKRRSTAILEGYGGCIATSHDNSEC
jgi:hypothetical protein